MKVIFNYNRDYSTNLPSAIALGTFDGIHLGHRQLIYELLQQKKKYKLSDNCIHFHRASSSCTGS
jgi:FAD synthase